ncbi:DNA-directed RNA polymerase subunit delta [Neobacillus sp. DY30]|uniref:DNA-directed RNA polymerase subunit delta n=1 Tax=Neobacillus sp. DY30 TaxID=3047871 RepID=UPI0024BFE8C3|nr:DNA-directed RNA polymerase subunit delta [Neobacillus sp. DY30]WHY00600.1 DNA-directed RNA polymerase subunit delta [Neobacillus sp. DY30]
MSLQGYSKEQLKEFSLIELAYEFLKNSKQPIAFNDLINEIAAATELTEDQIRSRIAQFYTDINIDGRFLSLGENRWGLRVWYPVDTQEEEVVTVIKPKKKKAKKVVDEDELEDFDDIDEDYDELDDFADEDDLLDDEDDDLLDDLDDVDDLDDDDDVIDDDDEFDLDEEEELDEVLEDEDEELDEVEDEDDDLL